MAQQIPAGYTVPQPYNPQKKTGDKTDDARYLLQPGEQFLLPWLALPGGGQIFVWPCGLQGFSVNIEPTLGTHKYIGEGANRLVEVEVMHKGEETITMSGSFPGLSSVDNYRALKNMVYATQPRDGKLLYLPHIETYVERVAVASARFDHPDELGSGRDLTYEIEFKLVGFDKKAANPALIPPLVNPSGAPKGRGQNVFIVNSTINTLRKIATAKYGDATRWTELYALNTAYFYERKTPIYMAPDFRLPVGLRIYY